MATNATAQWWIRTDAAAGDTGGGGYDAGIASAGTNYANQAAAQATFASLTLAAGTITDVAATGAGTAAMIGNAFNVPGQGYYWITAVPTTNTYTVTAGTGATSSFTTQPGKIGGALRNPKALSNGGGVSAPATATALVPGNIINVRAGGGSVGSPDYAQTSHAQYPAGDATNGMVHWLGFNGVPIIKGDGLLMYQISFHKVEGLYVATSSTVNAATGIINLGAGSLILNCTVDMQNQVAMVGVYLGTNTTSMIGVEVIGGGTSSSHGVFLTSYGSIIAGCNIHGCGGDGVNGTPNAGTVITDCLIWGNTGDGIHVSAATVEPGYIKNNTIHGNGGDGIELTSSASVQNCAIFNNNLTGNGTGGTGYGLNISAGSAAVNDLFVFFCDYNNYGTGATQNQTGARNNLSAGAHDLAVNPQYTNAAGGDFTPANTATRVAYPTTF